MKFDYNGRDYTVKQYFYEKYGITLKEAKQPLFLTTMNNKEAFIPVELCKLDGVPETIRSNQAKMKPVLDSARKTPNEKYQTIQEFSGDLFRQSALSKWGLSIERQALEMNVSQLPLPTF